MIYNLPSVKTLDTLAPGRGKELRKVLKCESLRELQLYKECPQDCRSFQHAKLTIATHLIPAAHGVERIPAGHNAKSPAIEYCNAGDPYIPTLMWVSGRGYKVGCWGDIVERGNYD